MTRRRVRCSNESVGEDDEADVRVAAATSLCAGRRPSTAEALEALAQVPRAAAAASPRPSRRGLDDPAPRLIAALSDEDPRHSRRP